MSSPTTTSTEAETHPATCSSSKNMEPATPPNQPLPPQKPAQLYESKPLPPLPPIPSRSCSTSKPKRSSSNRQVQKSNPSLPGSRPIKATTGYSQRRSQSQRTSTSKPRPPPIYLPPLNSRYGRCTQHTKIAVGPSYPLSPPPENSSTDTPAHIKRYSMLITPDDLTPPPLLSGALTGAVGIYTAPASPTSSSYASEGAETTVSEPAPFTPGPDVYENYSLDDIDYDADETLVSGSFLSIGTPDSPVSAVIQPLNIRRVSNRASGVSGYSSSVYSDASPPQSHQPVIDRGSDNDMAGNQTLGTMHDIDPSNTSPAMEEYVIKDMYHASVGQIAASTRESPTIQRTTSSISQRTLWPTMDKVKRRFSTKWIPGAPSLRGRPVSVPSSVTSVDRQSLKSANTTTTTVPMLKSTFEEDDEEDVEEGKNKLGYILKVFGRTRRRQSVVFENNHSWSEKKDTPPEKQSTWPEPSATARKPKLTSRQSKFALGLHNLGSQAKFL